jgi:hypothetical protein
MNTDKSNQTTKNMKQMNVDKQDLILSWFNKKNKQRRFYAFNRTEHDVF